MVDLSKFGYFSSADQDLPEFDPGLDIDCLVCSKRLEPPLKTISLFVPNTDRSYFYRTHRNCYDSLSDNQKTMLDSQLVDKVFKEELSN